MWHYAFDELWESNLMNLIISNRYRLAFRIFREMILMWPRVSRWRRVCETNPVRCLFDLHSVASVGIWRICLHLWSACVILATYICWLVYLSIRDFQLDISTSQKFPSFFEPPSWNCHQFEAFMTGHYLNHILIFKHTIFSILSKDDLNNIIDFIDF